MGNLSDLAKIKTVPKETKKSKSLKVGKPESKSKIITEITTEKKDVRSNGRVFMFFGEEGTGKTYACIQIARKFGKTLYLDTENKCAELLDEQFAIQYDVKRPIIDDDKKFSEIFRKDSDMHIIVVQKINATTGKRDDVATVKYIEQMTPKLLHFIKSGKYGCVVIDSVLPIWEFAYSEWLNRHKGRERPNKFEYTDIEAIKQDILFPFINICKIYGVELILTASIVGHYVNDVMIGYKQDAKAWLLHILTYEMWFSRDYKKYVIKHPYKPYWEIQDETLDIGEYLFDKDYIENNADFKNFEDFKYETMTSDKERKDRKTLKTIVVGK